VGLPRKWKMEVMIARRDSDGLIAALEDPGYRRSTGRAVRTVNALGRFGDRRAVPTIIDVMREAQSAPIRSTAAIALGRIRDPAAIPALRPLLHDDDRATRMWTMRSLGQLQDRGSVEALTAALVESDGGVRQYAAKALGEIGDQAASPALIDALSDRKQSVRELAALSLAQLGDSRALEPVRRAHEESRGFTRRRIGRALGELETRFG
jgi:HEAT repeat protein